MQRNLPPIALEVEPGLAAAPRHEQMIALNLLLLVGADGRAVPEQQQQQQGLEEIKLAQIHADRVKGAVIERSHLHVFNAGARERTRGALAGPQRVLRAHIAVVLVLDLQRIGGQLLVFAADFHAQGSERRMRRFDRVAQIAQILFQAVDRDRDRALAAVAVTQIAHAQRGGIGPDQRVGSERLEPVLGAIAQKRAAQSRGGTKQVRHDPAVPAVVAQQIEIARRAKILLGAVALAYLGKHRPERRGHREIEMHAGNRLHHAAVAYLEAVTVNELNAPLVRWPIARDRHVLIAAQFAGHRAGPQQLIADAPVDELMQVAQVVEQCGVIGEGRRDQLDERFGIIGRDVRIGQGGAERARLRGAGDMPGGIHTQRFALDAPAAAREQLLLAAVAQRRQTALKYAIDACSTHPSSTYRFGRGILSASSAKERSAHRRRPC